jgi:hypothetical protein
MNKTVIVLLLAIAVSSLVDCRGGGGEASSTPTTTHSVTLSWNQNRESGVNKAGGGYAVSITGQPTITVPYVSGSSAPTTTTVVLNTGTYTVTVRAYAALDAQGGGTGSISAQSNPYTLVVP